MTHPDTSTTRGKIKVMEAAERGEQIEYKLEGSNEWHTPIETRALLWDWNHFTYRIAPKPSPLKYRPWKMEEVPVGEVIQGKLSGNRYLIEAVEEGRIQLSGGGYLDVNKILANFTLLDGSPCGTREEGN